MASIDTSTWDEARAISIYDHGQRVTAAECGDPQHDEMLAAAKQWLFDTNGRCYEPDLINHPPHYNAHPSGVECIDIVEHMNFNLGNAIKYLWRADLKNEVEDLKKAAWYVQREIERREKSSESVRTSRQSGSLQGS